MVAGERQGDVDGNGGGVEPQHAPSPAIRPSLPRSSGIPEANRSVLFEPYVRGEAGERGIGVSTRATVKRLAEAHGGSVGVDSRPEGRAAFGESCRQIPEPGRTAELSCRCATPHGIPWPRRCDASTATAEHLLKQTAAGAAFDRRLEDLAIFRRGLLIRRSPRWVAATWTAVLRREQCPPAFFPATLSVEQDRTGAFFLFGGAWARTMTASRPPAAFGITSIRTWSPKRKRVELRIPAIPVDDRHVQ